METNTNETAPILAESASARRKAKLLAEAAKAPKATKVSSVGNPDNTKKAKTPKVTEIRMCICHCGEATTNQFRQGHDARAKGQLIRWMKDHKDTLIGFQNDELIVYALAGGFSGRFVGVQTKRAPRAPKAEAA